ncbi:MarR family winged helix-turn-helix transcriptional regulator [Qipengyuania sp. XHP0207]|uniref:MarR family winged helix-turn-helix transcriptional regulator n=1 Tax=Qipengyuania sp. XHP0207 TaxID=3038078 RepID=UPI00241C16B9|nr:MarR family winged helix-turn-helix transcriptional regulator [Qipengyuania sp. XHP0207]MDG5749273.1 MarR family winged helix-turn-helix transcriptional regulator [Qipengyuania sp. XHP0207]
MTVVSEELQRFIADYDDLGINLLTVDGRILLFLQQRKQSRIKELMLASGSSYRGFYLALDRLKEKGLITSVMDPEDKRARIIQLSSG